MAASNPTATTFVKKLEAVRKVLLKCHFLNGSVLMKPAHLLNLDKLQN